MSKAYLFVTCLFFAFLPTCSLSAQIPCSDFVFNRWYNQLMYATTIKDCITTQDSNAVAVGYYITNYDSLRCLIFKANRQGEIVWRNDVIFDGTYETAHAVTELPDGSFIVVGDQATLVGADTFAHAYLAKFSANGEIIWEKSFDTPSVQEYFRMVALCPNGDLILLGEQTFMNIAPADWLLRLDGNGNVLWEQFIPNIYGYYSILSIPSGGFWLSARRNFQTYLFRVDDSGNIVDEVNAHGYAEKLIPIDKNTFIAVGAIDQDLWIAKFDMEGELQWEKQYGGSSNESGHHVSVIPSGGYYVLGSTFSQDGDVCLSRGGGDHWVLKLDDAGNMLWQKSYGGSGWDIASGGIVTCDDGFMLVGETTSHDWDCENIPNHQIFYSPLWMMRCNNLRYEKVNLVQADTSICLDAPLSLTIDPLNCAEELRWNTGETSSLIQPDSQGVYWVEQVYGSCFSRDSVRIQFLPCNGESCVLFPNAFTPNSDGSNDYFQPLIQCGEVVEMNMLVYNRWGQLVYKSNHFESSGWDGKSSDGELLASDLYFWRCTYQHLLEGQKNDVIQSGEIVLLR
ncbi:MAG: gliding motility-associated C-terminal domain-containing protein [Saprospiraceae bacterium]|nr:gliding motility-associated C-terminal domain-containing protein [Saprospiraceae bacterium]